MILPTYIKNEHAYRIENNYRSFQFWHQNTCIPHIVLKGEFFPLMDYRVAEDHSKGYCICRATCRQCKQSLIVVIIFKKGLNGNPQGIVKEIKSEGT